jgi:hypothetical protein
MLVGMAWWAQRIYPVPYQWRRATLAAAAGIALVVAGKLIDSGLAVSFLLVASYPIVLAATGFLAPAERAALSRIVRRRARRASPGA